jgi:hypothetical protein
MLQFDFETRIPWLSDEIPSVEFFPKFLFLLIFRFPRNQQIAENKKSKTRTPMMFALKTVAYTD